MGDVRDGGFQLRVAALQLQTLVSQRLKLLVDSGGQRADGAVAGGDGDQRVRVRAQPVVQLVRDFPQGRAQRKQPEQQRERGEREKRAQYNQAKKSAA